MRYLISLIKISTVYCRYEVGSLNTGHKRKDQELVRTLGPSFSSYF